MTEPIPPFVNREPITNRPEFDGFQYYPKIDKSVDYDPALPPILNIPSLDGESGYDTRLIDAVEPGERPQSGGREPVGDLAGEFSSYRDDYIGAFLRRNFANYAATTNPETLGSAASVLGAAAVGAAVMLPGLSTIERKEPLPQPSVKERAAAARRVLDSHLVRTLHPIVSALRGDPSQRDRVESALFGGPSFQGKPSRFLLRGDMLRTQRSLKPWEEQQLETMEGLSSANPFIMAARQAPEITSVCLQAHFDRLGQATRERFPSGSYTPLVVLGAGVHGTIAAGELLRQRPDIAEMAVFVDRNHTPGGPFAYPNGKAWNLNSASPRSEELFPLPDIGPQDSLRELGGGMLRWYPGERRSSLIKKARQGSINRVVEYFPAPDTQANERYIDNEAMSLALQEQAALAIGNLLNNSELVSVEQTTGEGQGSLKLTVRETGSDGSAIERVHIQIICGLRRAMGNLTGCLRMI